MSEAVTSRAAALTRALAIREKVLGPDHPDVSVASTTSPDLPLTKDAYAEAEPLSRARSRFGRRRLEPDHHSVAMSSTRSQHYQ